VNGEAASLSDTKVEITELPVRTWTNQFKEFLDGLQTGTEKQPASIKGYKEYNTDTTVKFVVEMKEEDLRKVETQKGVHTFFKLQTTMSTTSMVLYDSYGCMKRYDTPMDVMKEFFELRLKMYEKRKKYLEGALGAEACKLSNQARFILEKCDGTLKIENKKKKLMIEELSRRGYDSDPVNAWKKTQNQTEDQEESNEEEREVEETDDSKGPDFSYLLGMPMWNLTQEKKDSIVKNRDERQQELKRLKATTKEDMWRTDLEEFLTKLDEVEAQEIADQNEAAASSKMKMVKGGKGAKIEFRPSAHAIRISPVIADDLKAKVSKAVAAKERKEKGEVKKKVVKKEEEELDEFDLMAADKGLDISLSKKLGTPPKKRPALKKGEKKKNPWEDSDGSGMSGSELSDAMDSAEVAPRERAGGKRAAASKAKFKFGDSDSEASDKSDSEEELFDNTGVKEKDIQTGKVSDASDDDDDSHIISPTPPKKTASKPKKRAVFDSDSDDEKPNGNGNGMAALNGDSDSEEEKIKKKPAAKKPAAKKPAKKLTSSDDLFDSMISNGDKKPAPAPKKKATKKKFDFDDDSGSDMESKPKKKAPAKKAVAKKAKVESDGSESDFNMEDVAPARDRPGRGKKTVNYGAGSDSDSDFV